MASVAGLFIETAEAAVGLLRDPAVAAKWDAPSALADFSVGGLAEHLARQMVLAVTALSEPVPGEPAIDVFEHYVRSAWVTASLDDETNKEVRKRHEELASEGVAEFLSRAEADLATAREVLLGLPSDRVVRLSWTSWSLPLDDFLTTRMIEMVVHVDDLAVSVGVPTPDLPPGAVGIVTGLLTRLAVHRHGPVPVLRALSRAERSPATISAF